MSEHITILKEPPPPVPDRIAFSNSVRLSGAQWLGIAFFSAAFIVLAPWLWQRFEDFPLEPDYRMPYALSQDYWLYERYAAMAVQKYDVVVIGDSVIWGEYAKREETLPHYLNAQAGKERFANLGLDGAHPLALSGLVEHYAGSIRNTSVLLECNPLWFNSPEADLQDDKKVNEFSHTKLVPQFWPRIPKYKMDISPRLGVLVEQRVPFSKWTNHLQQAYYNGSDVAAWTLEHPYANPLAPLTSGLPASDNELRHSQLPWFKSSSKQVDMAWIDLDTSLQWPAFQRTVEILQQRGNRVFVMVGPFNEHMLTPGSLARYQKVKGTIAAWLKEKEIPHFVPEKLPRDLYGDASHPLPGGYEMLAQQLMAERDFQSMLAPR